MTTQADAINESCQTAAWSGAASFYPSMTTFSSLEAQLDAWSQFTLADLDDIANNTVVLPTSGIAGGVATVNATVHGKSILVYGWARPKGQTAAGACVLPFNTNGKCSLMIPGSGINQADAIVSSNSGYQAAMYSPLCGIGDTIVHVLPGSDWRMLSGSNHLGYLRQDIDDILLSRGSSLALLEIIEACVLMAFIKSTYSKTAVLGISKGAWQAMQVALLMSPTATVCASGVSLASKTQGFQMAGGNVIPGANYDDIASKVAASPTSFRFTKSSVSEIAIMAYEVTTLYTDAVLNSSNCVHVTHASGHVYDPGMGAWLAAALA